jgi:hypothetical protein
MSDKSRRRLLADAAAAVGINISQLAADEHPWSSSHPMATAWGMALKELNPSVGEQMEADFGKPLSLALTLALDGDRPLTQDLLGEWQTKRPQQYREYKQGAIDEALQKLRDASDAHAAANTPQAIAEREAQLQGALDASRRQAQLHQLRQHQ